jgi:uridine kinase
MLSFSLSRPILRYCLEVHRSALLNQLVDTISAIRRGHTTRVAVDGVDGAGKTTLADEPAPHLDRRVIRASIDGFHRPRAERLDYYEHSFNYRALIENLLTPLGPGGSRRFRRAVFDYRTDEPVDSPIELAHDDDILLFDGIFLQRPEIRAMWDFVIWVEAPFEITIARGVARAQRNDKLSERELAALACRYRERYVPGQQRYIRDSRPTESADVVVENADLSSPGLRHLTFRRDTPS